MMKVNQRGQDVEVRQVTLREVAASEGVLQGVAAVYNQESEDLGGFVETIEPGFFENVLTDDARCLWNHNDDLVLGRRKNGSLSLEDGQDGLLIRVVPPDTSWGRDALVSVGRGDVDQMSFAFLVKKGGDTWTQGKDGMVRRRLLRGGCERLYEVSPVTFPAYPQTSVAARSQLEAFNSQAETADNDAQVGGEAGWNRARARHSIRRKTIEIEIMRGG